MKRLFTIQAKSLVFGYKVLISLVDKNNYVMEHEREFSANGPVIFVPSGPYEKVE